MLDLAILHRTAELLNAGAFTGIEAHHVQDLINECLPEQRDYIISCHNQAVNELVNKIKENKMKNTTKIKARITQVREERKVKRVSMKYTGNKNPYAALAVNHNGKPVLISTRRPK